MEGSRAGVPGGDVHGLLLEGQRFLGATEVEISPTGRSAPAIGASTGIEPLFRLTDPHLPDLLRPAVRTILDGIGRADLIEYAVVHGRLPHASGLPDGLRRLLATATEISPSGHLAMAATVQACVDEAVSKTVNLPAAATAGDVHDIYRSAWELGCKGITVYRNGSRTSQPKAP